MKSFHIAKTAFTGLLANKPRSLLTILGIVIGITAIILTVSIGQGAKNLILSQIQSMGSRTIVVEPGRMPKGPSDFNEVFTESLKREDLVALAKTNNVPGLQDMAPWVQQVGNISYGNETLRKNIIGTSNLFADILDLYPEKGVFLAEEDIKQQSSVVVIGNNIKEDLFGEGDALGNKIKIKGKTFRVIGILPQKGRSSFLDADETIIVPYTTAQQYLFGISHFHAIMVRAKNENIVAQVADDVTATLREQHKITNPDNDDFHVTTQADAMEMVGIITGVLTALLTSIAAISLVVGGVGIMNIMLVSVTERTREIGLRKALGATYRDILNQFLLESVILTASGGIVGIIAGALLSLLIAVILSAAVATDWSFSFSISAALWGLGISSLIGLVFGLYPARQAARKSPMEALRYE